MHGKKKRSPEVQKYTCIRILCMRRAYR